MTNTFKTIPIVVSYLQEEQMAIDKEVKRLKSRKIRPSLEDFQSPYKVFSHLDRVKQLKESGDTYPIHMTVGLTNHCNHKCTWCYINWNQAGALAKRSGSQGANSKKAINASDRIIKAVSEAKELGLKAITLVGDGEPTLHPKFTEYLKSLKELDLDIGIFTNMSTKKEEVLMALLENCFFIRCSIDSATEETHKIQHGVDDFNVVINNLKKIVLSRVGPKPIIGVQFVVNHRNYQEISAAARLYKELGVEYITFKPAYKNVLNTAHEENMANLEKVIVELRKAKDYESSDFKVYVKESQFLESIAFKFNEGRYYSRCYATPLSPYLDEDGSMEMCGNLKGRGFTMGNVNELSFKEIWESKKRHECINSIDLNQCPSGCKLDPLNKVLWDAFHPEELEFHPNFI